MAEPAISPQLAARRANLQKAQAVPREIRYRMTEKRLAACRRNLAKARAVPREIRFRPTEKRLAANRANLCKAREKARTEGATLRHGMSCRTLQASLAAAGETLQAFEGFFRRFADLFRPKDKMETTLVQGLAHASWRRLRAFRVRARWEARKLAQVLREFQRRRRAREAREAEDEQERRCRIAELRSAPAGGTQPVPRLPDHADLKVGATEKRAEDLDRRSALREMRIAAERRECVLRILAVFYECARTWRNIQTLNRRIVCLLHLLLTLKLIPHEELSLHGLGEKTFDKVLSQSSEAMGNPLLSPSRMHAPARSGAMRKPGCAPERWRVPSASSRDERLEQPETWQEMFTAALGTLDEEELELVAQAAAAAWQRLELFRNRAQKEAEALEKILNAPAASANSLRAAAMALVRAFGDELAMIREAQRLEEQLESSLERLLLMHDGKLHPAQGAAGGREAGDTATSAGVARAAWGVVA
jgi:hypothetical protein